MIPRRFFELPSSGSTKAEYLKDKHACETVTERYKKETINNDQIHLG